MIASQRYRSIYQERQAFAEGTVKEFKIPTDTVSKRAVLRVSGSFQITHSGAPTVDEGGVLGRILSLIQVSDGNDQWKNIDPLMQRKFAHLVTGKLPLRRYATGASAPTSPTAEMATAGAPFSMPATTQYVYFEEELPIFFEDILAYGLGKQATLWDTKGNVGARIRVTCGTIANLAQAGALGTGVSYSNISINMDLILVEVPHESNDPKNPFLRLKQALIPFSVPPGSQAYGFELPKTRGKILDCAFLVRDSSSSALLSDTAIKKVRMIADGNDARLDANFRDLQATNRQHGYADNVMASGRHSMQGFAFANFRQDGDIAKSGIDLSQLSNLVVNFDASSSTDSPAESGTSISVLVAYTELRSAVA